MKALVALVLTLPVLLGGGCSTTTEPLTAVASLRPGHGYVFGRFRLRLKKHDGTLALVLRGMASSEEYLIVFRQKQADFAVALPAGRYVISAVAFLRPSRLLEAGRKPFRPGGALRDMSAPFDVPAGHLVYLGDFYASVPLKEGLPHWSLHTIRFEPHRAIRALRKSLPNLESMPAATAFPAPVERN